MPQVDMPIEELKLYTGSSPRPDDLDAYWDKQVASLKDHSPDPVWEEADFQVPFAKAYHLYFKGDDGSKIHAKVLIPKGEGPYPGILKFHGYSMNSGDFSDLLHYTSAGFLVAAMDCRGQGGKSQDLGGVSGGTLYGHIVKGLDDGVDALYYRHVFLDMVILADIIKAMPLVDGRNLAAIGGSQGGALTLACGALVKEVTCLVPVYPFLSDYQRVWEMDLDQAAYVGLRDYFRRFDPLHEKEDEFFRRLSYIDIANLTHRIQGRVLFATTLLDDICPPSTQFAAYNRIKADKDLLVYSDFGHEHLPGLADRELQFLLKWKEEIDAE